MGETDHAGSRLDEALSPIKSPETPHIGVSPVKGRKVTVCIMNVQLLLCALFCAAFVAVDARLTLRSITNAFRAAPKVSPPPYKLVIGSFEAFQKAGSFTRGKGFKELQRYWTNYQEQSLVPRNAEVSRLRPEERVDLLTTVVGELETLRVKFSDIKLKSYLKSRNQLLEELSVWQRTFLETIKSTLGSLVVSASDPLPGAAGDRPDRYFDPRGPFFLANSYVAEEAKFVALACLYAFGNPTCSGKKIPGQVLPADLVECVQSNLEVAQSMEASIADWLQTITNTMRDKRLDPKGLYKRAYPFVDELLGKLTVLIKRLKATTKVEPLPVKTSPSLVKRTLRVITGGLV